MKWEITFISKDDFKNHVKKTIKKYGEKLLPYDVPKFNKNIIDPIKMIFDKAVYGYTWEDIIIAETFRQRDKSNNNEIGYFHQHIFKFFDGCKVPPNGEDGGWDIIITPNEGYDLHDGSKVKTIYCELKNKHNTMNSASSQNTYIKMQNQLLNDDDCVCFLVEAIATRSQNIIWAKSVDKKKMNHARIRRVSIDKTYEIATGDPNAFFKVCMVLPDIVKEILSDSTDNIEKPVDTVYESLLKIAKKIKDLDEDTAMLMSMYILGFGTYNGFDEYDI